VRVFYKYLEVVQDEDQGIILQTYVQGHILQINPQVISDLIDVPVLPISASPFSEDMEPPTLEQLREYFHAHP
jgi:DNA-binding transcriptional regulator of glucitol operon